MGAPKEKPRRKDADRFRPPLGKGLPAPDEQKFKELILYISEKCAYDKKFGATKLNKILYLADFLAYGITGKPITAVEYQKLAQGPAPRRLKPIRAQMIEAEELDIQRIRLAGGRVQHRTVNLRSADLSIFSGEEISIVDEVIQMCSEMTAHDASEFSHRMVGWKVVGDGETIPYETVFVSNEPPTEAQIAYGQRLARELGLVEA